MSLKTRRAQEGRQTMLGWSRPVRPRELVTKNHQRSARAKIRARADASKGEGNQMLGVTGVGNVTEQVWFVSLCKHYKISDMSRHVSSADISCILCSMDENKNAGA